MPLGSSPSTFGTLGGSPSDNTALVAALAGKAAASHTHPLGHLTQSGAAAGQVPKWNGSAWAPFDAFDRQQIPVRFCAMDAQPVVGSYDLIKMARAFIVDELRLVFDGFGFSPPYTTLDFSIDKIDASVTEPKLTYTNILDSDVHMGTVTPFYLSVGQMLKLNLTTFDPIGYIGGTVRGGVVWIGGYWL